MKLDGNNSISSLVLNPEKCGVKDLLVLRVVTLNLKNFWINSISKKIIFIFNIF